MAGQPFTAGLPLFANRKGTKDASSVRALKDAGAYVVGLYRPSPETVEVGLGVSTHLLQKSSENVSLSFR